MKLSIAILALVAASQATLLADPLGPVLGGSYGQTMRIAVTADGIVGCSAIVGFRNGLAQPPDPDRTLTIAAGQTSFVDLDLSRHVSRYGERIELRPMVRVTAGNCTAGAEVFDEATRRTTAAIRLNTSLTNPPEPDFQAFGVIAGQSIRLLIGRDADASPRTGSVNPCNALIGLRDEQGRTVSAKRITLAAGSFDFVQTDPPIPDRVMHKPFIEPLSTPSDLAGCQASIQIFDRSTGWTTVASTGR